jgi:sec-independent protein translocase protein TatA
MFTSIGGPEILVIFLIILLLFGADKLPELARGIGKGMNEFRKASDNLKNEFEKSKNEINNTYQTTFEEQWAVDSDENDLLEENNMWEENNGEEEIEQKQNGEIEQNGEADENENYKDNLN